MPASQASHIKDEEHRIAELMMEVYRARGKFVLSPDKKRLALRDVTDPDLHERVRESRRQIVEVLRDDPIDGIGWGVRSIFFLKMCEVIDEKVPIGSVADERAQKALYSSNWMQALNTLHLNGSFEDFRAELLRMSNRVIDYAYSSEKEPPAFVG